MNDMSVFLLYTLAHLLNGWLIFIKSFLRLTDFAIKFTQGINSYDIHNGQVPYIMSYLRRWFLVKFLLHINSSPSSFSAQITFYLKRVCLR